MDIIKLKIKLAEKNLFLTFNVFYILMQNVQNLLGVYLMQTSNQKALIAFPKKVALGKKEKEKKICAVIINEAALGNYFSLCVSHTWMKIILCQLS